MTREFFGRHQYTLIGCLMTLANLLVLAIVCILSYQRGLADGGKSVPAVTAQNPELPPLEFPPRWANKRRDPLVLHSSTGDSCRPEPGGEVALGEIL